MRLQKNVVQSHYCTRILLLCVGSGPLALSDIAIRPVIQVVGNHEPWICILLGPGRRVRRSLHFAQSTQQCGYVVPAIESPEINNI
jgi:hypothetical protein